jgi:AraC-like DNA-binding protein
MAESAKEYFRYLAVDPRNQDWGLSVTGAGYQPVAAGDDPIPKRRHPPGHFYRWEAGRVLSEYAVVYVTHGRGEFDSQATGLIGLEAGDALLLFPGVWHRYRPRTETGWGISWVHFQGPLAERLQARGVFTADRAVVPVGLDDAMQLAFQGLLDAVRLESTGAVAVAAAKAIEILARLQANAAPDAPLARLQEIVRQARLKLEEDPGGLPAVESLIASSGMSRTHFFRTFKRQTGQSPYRYHLQFTIRRAGEMLRNSRLSVKQVAIALGFRSPYHFSKLFKKKTGMPPRDYREHWRSRAAQRVLPDG